MDLSTIIAGGTLVCFLVFVKDFLDLKQEIREIKNATTKIFENTDRSVKTFEPWKK